MNKTEQYTFAERVNGIPKSFIREILKVTSQPDVISFAGGLPNPSCFPEKEIALAAQRVFEEDAKNVLQYAVSEGYHPLREYISERYRRKHGIDISPEEILIVNGSQQGLDLAAKLFLNKGDKVLLERPSYLGAIQAFSVYQPEFITIPLLEDGINIPSLEEALYKNEAKLFYTVPNFQNPTGISYSLEKKKKVAELLRNSNTFLIEDDPYGEIRFMGEYIPPIKKFNLEQTILLGSFSKIISPGMRLGWVAAPKEIIEKMIVMKQAADLHSNFLSQRIIYRYLRDNSLDEHINRLKTAYAAQRNCMIEMIWDYFPKEISYTKPEGGMFIWLTLPEELDAFVLLEEAAKEKVVFVPGKTFYASPGGENTIRLNFSNSNAEQMEEGIRKLGTIFKRAIA